MKKIFLFIALTFALSGCSNDDSTPPSETLTLIGHWTETDPTAGRHKLTFLNATQLGLGDDSEEGIIYDYTYTRENDMLTVTRPDGSSTTHDFEIVNINTIKITGIGFYAQPANEPPTIVTFVKD